MSKGWRYKVNMKQHITGEETYEAIIKASNSIALELRCLPARFFDDFDFSDNVEFLASVCADDAMVVSEMEMLREVNYRLEEIYNFADANRIWLG